MEAATPQQAVGKAAARGVIADSGLTGSKKYINVLLLII